MALSAKRNFVIKSLKQNSRERERRRERKGKELDWRDEIKKKWNQEHRGN